MTTPIPAHILVIDDEPAILKLFTMMFSRLGYQIDTAGSGEAGVEKIGKTDYRLIITDIKMPGMTGEEVLAHVRDIRGSHVPVIAMSATPWLLDKDKFDAVLPKPFSRQELFDTIRDLLPAGNFAAASHPSHPGRE